MLTDLPGYLERELGFSREDVQMAIRNGVYGLYPDDPSVPVDFKLAVAERKRAIEQQHVQAQQESEAKERYQYMLGMAARGASPESFPESTDWYDGDHLRYARALEKTALTMAAEAEKRGEWVDLNPAAVQKRHEAELAGRFTKVQQKKAARAKPATTEPEAKAAATNTTVASTVSATAGRTPSARKSRADAEREADEIISRMLNPNK